jgi:hypothetical protein
MAELSKARGIQDQKAQIEAYRTDDFSRRVFFFL